MQEGAESGAGQERGVGMASGTGAVEGGAEGVGGPSGAPATMSINVTPEEKEAIERVGKL